MTRPAVLVTGGARRIGAAIARAFGAAGWHVVIHYDRSRKAAQALARELPSAQTVQCDLADPDLVAILAQTLAGALPDWRMVVNCAAKFEPDSATALDAGVLARAMAVNAQAPALLAQGFLSHAQAPGGRRVVQITDQKLANPNPDFFAYTMSKHALAATVPMLAMGADARPEDRIYAIAPGAILASYDQDEAEAERSHRMNLLRRRTGADEIAAACLFLAEGRLASGTTVFVDSGQHLLAQPRDVIYLARDEG